MVVMCGPEVGWRRTESRRGGSPGRTACRVRLCRQGVDPGDLWKQLV